MKIQDLISYSSGAPQAVETNSSRAGKGSIPKTRHSGEVSREKLDQAVQSLRDYSASVGVKLNFQVNMDKDSLQVEVLDPKSDQLIRKIPADQALDLADSIQESMAALLRTEL